MEVRNLEDRMSGLEDKEERLDHPTEEMINVSKHTKRICKNHEIPWIIDIEERIPGKCYNRSSIE